MGKRKHLRILAATYIATTNHNPSVKPKPGGRKSTVYRMIDLNIRDYVLLLCFQFWRCNKIASVSLPQNVVGLFII